MIKSSLFILTILLISGDYSFAGDGFGPWNADVAVADENIAGHSRAVNKTTNVFNAPKAGAYFLIRGFQIFVSPQDGPNCKFTPTCSAYGRIAVMRYGAVIGGFLAGDRLLRCNPYTAPGYDPVPESLFK